MNLPKHILFLILLSVGSLSLGQIPKHIFNGCSGETYDAKDFAPAKAPVEQLIGVYHFGESEGEWDFVMLKNGDNMIVQVWNAQWAADYYTKKETWQSACKTFNHAVITGNKITFGRYTGMFTDHRESGKTERSLLLFASPVSNKIYAKDNAEAGYYSMATSAFYSNTERYQLSLVVRPETYFKGKSKQDLKIMRNTIYANYGLIFLAGGEMECYFKAKAWYRPFRKDVSDCLTDIENKNIETITRLEKM